jgi:hypothetical protein
MKLIRSRFLRQIGSCMLILAMPAGLYAAGERRFDTPDEAVKILTEAVRGHDTNTMHAIFGPEGHELVSPDVVQRTEEFDAFVKRLTEKTELRKETDGKVEVDLGNDGWPFPIPLVKEDDGKWFFDTEAGSEEILNRRIGADELGAIAVSKAYVEAQREYASKDRYGTGVLEYAQHLRSTAGTHDGLYWPAKEATDEVSPLGPLIAQAHVEGYRHDTKALTDQLTPYHGYFFKILTKQGSHAPIGKYDYVINGHMIGGFAFIAWPEKWGNTGVMTFIVNQQGKIYQKNLGPKTSSIAEDTTRYDPDDSWKPVGGR